MTNHLFRIALAIGIMMAPAPAQQQPMGGTGETPATRSAPELPSLEPLTVDLTGELLQIDSERNAIQIQIKKNPKPMGLLVDPKCKIKGDKKQFTKKDLTLTDLEAGYQLELVVRRADRHVIEMKVKKQKEKSADAASPRNN